MGYVLPTSAVLVIVACGTACANPTVSSWKKPANTYEKFVSDSIMCAKHGYFRDVANDEPAKAFVRGWRTADDNLNRPSNGMADTVESYSDTIRRTQPARRMAQVQALHVSDVEQCLTEQGYVKFALSKDQAQRLGKLQRGSEARRQYLYKLSIE